MKRRLEKNYFLCASAFLRNFFINQAIKSAAKYIGNSQYVYVYIGQKTLTKVSDKIDFK